MAASKFKLSETLKVLARRVNSITNRDVFLSLGADEASVEAGQSLSVQATVRSPEKARRIDYLTLNLKGRVQRDGKWRDYTEGVEVAHDVVMEADQEIVIPVIILIPEDAVLSEDGGEWMLSGRVVLDSAMDPRDEIQLTITAPTSAPEA